MIEASILEVRVEYHRDNFSLHAAFALRSPWTLLFGASGAGKTTLLRILVGLTPPSAGYIRLGNNQLLDSARGIATPPGQRKIGLVPQQAVLFPHLTVRDNIGFGIHQWTRSVRESRIEELLVFFEIEAFANRKPSRLSGGERQRIAIAQALAPRPDLLLLDEPFNALDVPSRISIIRKLHAVGAPVLYVSHELGDAWQINADAILLESGRITAQGPTRLILASQRDRIISQLEA
jgi:ABC-type sulfate/molybdate transport systems ATPase subunit